MPNINEDIIYGSAVYKTNRTQVINSDKKNVGKEFIRTSGNDNFEEKINSRADMLNSKVVDLKRTVNKKSSTSFNENVEEQKFQDESVNNRSNLLARRNKLSSESNKKLYDYNSNTQLESIENNSENEVLLNGAALYKESGSNVINEDKSNIGKVFIKESTSDVFNNKILNKSISKIKNGKSKDLLSEGWKTIENAIQSMEEDALGEKSASNAGYRMLNSPRQIARFGRTTRRTASMLKYATKSGIEIVNGKNSLINVITDKNRNIYKGKTGIITTIKEEIIDYTGNDDLGVQSLVKTKDTIYNSYRTMKSMKQGVGTIKKFGGKVKQASITTKNAVVNSVKYTTNVVNKIISATSMKSLAIIGIVCILCTALMSAMASVAALTASSGYAVDDTELNSTYAYITKLDADLDYQIKHIEEEYPDIEEFHYHVSVPNTDCDKLISYLAVKYDDFTLEEVKSKIDQIHNALYNLSTHSWTSETTSTHTNDDGTTSTSTTTIHHLDVNLETITVEDYMKKNKDTLFTTEEYQRYLNFNDIGGTALRQDLGNPFTGEKDLIVATKFGWSVKNKEKEFSNGINILMKMGTPINACKSGEVQQIGSNYVVIKSGNSTVYYGNCNSILVKQGQKVNKCDEIATVGGSSDGVASHIYLQYSVNNEYYNPLFYLDKGLFSNVYKGGFSGPGETIGSAGGNGKGTALSDKDFQIVMSYATTCIGLPYKMGGRDPSQGYLDCSGFVSWVYGKAGVLSSDYTAQGLCNISTPISENDVKPGDLIFFQGTYDCGDIVTHVGIYISPGVMLQSGNPCGYANLDSSYWQGHFYGYGRLT